MATGGASCARAGVPELVFRVPCSVFRKDLAQAPWRFLWRLSLTPLFVGLFSPLWADGWKAGVASVVITPQDSVWMSGYASRDRPAEGRLTELWAKALVVYPGYARYAERAGREIPVFRLTAAEPR